MKKQIILVLFVLLVLFSAASVSAEDNQTDDMAIDDIAADDFAVRGNTFADINSAIASTGAGKTLYLENTTYTGSSEILITKNIVINGATETDPDTVSVLDGGNVTRIFNIVGPYTVTLKNLVLINGIAIVRHSDSDLAAGGAVYGYMEGTNRIITLTMSNVVFKDNTALEGGAVYIRGRASDSICKFTVDNCTFINNRADNGAGAIYLYNSEAKVTNSNFLENTALRTNESGYSGGAIYSYGILEVDNCLFENNTGLYGGAILNQEKTATISNSRFLANIATTNSGSAIYNYEITAKLGVTNCTFMYNVANNQGSGIYNYRGTVTVVGSNFTNNSARSSALIFNDGGLVNITGSSFDGNVGTAGSVIYNQNCTSWGVMMGIGRAVITDCEFDLNIPINGTEIYNSAVLTLSSSKLNGNYTLIQNRGSLTLENNTMTSGEYLSIYNDGGVFTNPIRAIVLDNSTVKCYINQTIAISAVLLDLDNNTIGDTSFRFMVASPTAAPVIYKNGTYKENVTFSQSGLYPVSASVDSNGDRYILENGLVEVLPQPELKVAAADIIYSNNGTVDVSSSDLGSDEVAIVVKNTETGAVVFNSTMHVNGNVAIPDLDAGNYTAIIDFAGNDAYSPIANSTEFEVSRIAANVTVSVEDRNYGQTINGTVALVDANGKPISGTVTVAIGNWSADVAVADGRGNFAVADDLLPSNYTASVRFNGTNNYIGAVNSTNFTVEKLQSMVNINITDVDYGEAVSGIVKLTDANGNPIDGNVTVTIAGNIQEVAVTGGISAFMFSNLFMPDNYSAVASFAGDRIYLPSSDVINFTVRKIQSGVAINVSDAGYGNPISGTVSLNDVAGNPISATVTVTIAGSSQTVSVIAGAGDFTFYDILMPGNYSANVTFAGNEIYLPSSNVTEFAVARLQSSVSIDVADIDYGASISGTVNLTGAGGNLITGTVTVKIANLTYDVDVVDSSASFSFPDVIMPGNYSAIVSFAGNEIYVASSNASNFTVGRLQSRVAINVSDIEYDHAIVGSVSLTGVDGNPLNGTVTVAVDGLTQEVSVVDGAANFTFYDVIMPGNYSANVTFAGNEIYFASFNVTNFTVSKKDSVLEIAVPDIKVLDNITGTVSLKDAYGMGITGNVTVKIGNWTGNVSVTDGEGSFTINETLVSGSYTATATFNGSSTCNGSVNSTSFTVSKIDTVVEIDIPDSIRYDNITGFVYLKDSNGNPLNGTVNVVFENTDVSIDVTDGVANFTFDAIRAGVFDVTGSYDGNWIYNPSTINTTFEVGKIRTIAMITVPDVTYGSPIEGTVVVIAKDKSVVTSNVTVVVAGENITVNVENGIGRFVVDKILPAGTDYQANVTFDIADDKYYSSTGSTLFNVSRQNTTVEVAIANVTYGQSVTGNVTLAGVDGTNLTGTVVLGLNGQNITVNVVDGRGSFTISDLNAGQYNVTASYGGSENYAPVGVNGSFDVARAVPRIVIVVDNITYGDVAVCKIYLGDAVESFINAADLNSAVVNATIAGKDYEVPLNNGFGSVRVSNLDAGNYTASVTFDGDENYLPADNATVFHVSEAEASLVISMDNITYGDIATGNITVLGVNSTGLNGTAAVTINNETFNVTVVDGKGTIELDSVLAPGSYTANATFISPNYLEVANATAFTVAPINVTVSNVTVPYGSEGKVNVTLSRPLNGTLEVLFDNKTFNVTFSDGVGSFAVPADTMPGNYTVTASLANQTGVGSVEVVPLFNVTLEKTVDAANVNLSDEVTFTITVKNADFAAYNVTVTDLVDSSRFQLISASPSVGSYDESTGVWTVGSLGSGQTASLKLTVKAIAIGNFTNVAELAIGGFDFTLSANATVVVSDKAAPEDNGTVPEGNGSTNNTTAIKQETNTNIAGLKTANPILALLFAMVLIPLRRKFNR